jgi:hypothetical protein
MSENQSERVDLDPSMGRVSHPGGRPRGPGRDPIGQLDLVICRECLHILPIACFFPPGKHLEVNDLPGESMQERGALYGFFWGWVASRTLHIAVKIGDGNQALEGAKGFEDGFAVTTPFGQIALASAPAPPVRREQAEIVLVNPVPGEFHRGEDYPVKPADVASCMSADLTTFGLVLRYTRLRRGKMEPRSALRVVVRSSSRFLGL